MGRCSLPRCKKNVIELTEKFKGGVQLAKYCSKEHQVEHWKAPQRECTEEKKTRKRPKPRKKRKRAPPPPPFPPPPLPPPPNGKKCKKTTKYSLAPPPNGKKRKKITKYSLVETYDLSRSLVTGNDVFFASPDGTTWSRHRLVEPGPAFARRHRVCHPEDWEGWWRTDCSGDSCLDVTWAGYKRDEWRMWAMKKK